MLKKLPCQHGCQESPPLWIFGKELKLEKEIVLLRQFYSEISKPAR
jgi:hypothetical protein